MRRMKSQKMRKKTKKWKKKLRACGGLGISFVSIETIRKNGRVSAPKNRFCLSACTIFLKSVNPGATRWFAPLGCKVFVNRTHCLKSFFVFVLSRFSAFWPFSPFSSFLAAFWVFAFSSFFCRPPREREFRNTSSSRLLVAGPRTRKKLLVRRFS